MEPGLGLQERTERLLRRSEAVLCQRLPPPRAPPGRGREGRGHEEEEGASQDALQLWRAARRRGSRLAPPPVTSHEGRGSPRSQEAVRWRGAEPEDYSSHEALRPGGRGYEEEAPWGRAVGQEAAAGELLQQALDSDEAEAPEDPVLRALRGRRRALRGLLRLCSGPCADVWLYVTRHVRHPQNVKKIRGNLLWYRHLEETEGAPPPPVPAARAELQRLRQELGGLQEALGGAQRQALALEEELGAGLRRRGAGLAGALRLRVLGEAAAAEGRRLRAGLPVTPPRPRPEGAGPELAAAVAMGTEPEVLVALRSLSRERAETLRGLLEPRPPAGSQEQPTDAAQRRWLRAAQEVLSRHPPAAVLWALEQLALESTRGLKPLPSPLDLEAEAGAPPTVQSLLQECWGTVGGLWARLPPLGARLRPLRLRLQRLRRELDAALGGDPGALQAARLALVAAGLGGARAALAGGLRSLGGAPPNPPGAREELRGARGTALRSRHRLLRRQQRLRSLAASTAALRGGLRTRQAQVRVAAAALSRAPEALGREGQRLREVLGALGALGAPPLGAPTHGLPLWLPPEHPLRGLCDSLGLPPHKAPQELLLRVLRLRRELGRRRGAGLPQAPPIPAPAPPPEEGLAELLPRLRAVANQSRRRIEAWPRLQALISQWWEQPAQWVQATPPGAVPFSHWLQRWARAAHGHAPSSWPRPLPAATPTSEGRGEEEEPRP